MLFCGNKGPHPGGGWNLQAGPKIPGTPPCYLTTSQSEKSHTPFSPHPKIFLLKTSPPKPSGSLGFLSMSTLLGPAVELSLFQTPVFPYFALVWPHHELVSNYSTRHGQGILHLLPPLILDKAPLGRRVLVTQSCPTLCDPIDYGPPGSSVHRILQARILERVAIPFSRGSSQTRDQTRVSHIAGRP